MAIRKSHRSWALFTVKNKSVIVLGFDYGNNRRFFFHAPLNTLLNKVNDRITYGKLEDNSLFNMSGKWIPSEMSRIEGKNSRTGSIGLYAYSKAAMHAGIDKLAAMQAGIDILQIRQRRNQKQKTVNDLRTEVVDAVLIPFDATGLKKVFGDGVMKREETCSPLCKKVWCVAYSVEADKRMRLWECCWNTWKCSSLVCRFFNAAPRH
ncbi:hypothetical protein Tco_0374141 [Tanacetum coccineum]